MVNLKFKSTIKWYVKALTNRSRNLVRSPMTRPPVTEAAYVRKAERSFYPKLLYYLISGNPVFAGSGKSPDPISSSSELSKLELMNKQKSVVIEKTNAAQKRSNLWMTDKKERFWTPGGTTTQLSSNVE